MSQRYIYDKLDPEELVGGIGAIGSNIQEMATIVGIRKSRLLAWCKGTEEPPHYVTVLLALLMQPENLAEARAITKVCFRGIVPTGDGGNRLDYRVLSPEEFAQAQNDVGVGGTALARVFGVRLDRFNAWCNGRDGIPHYVTVLMALMANPENRKRAFEVTDSAIVDETDAEKRRLDRRAEKLAERHG
jgi:hypothetical protein